MFMKLLRTFADYVVERRRRELTYRELMALDDRQLADIGINRGMIAEVALTGAGHVTQVAVKRAQPSNVNAAHAA